MIPINVISDPTGQGFNRALYGEQNPANRVYFQQEFQNLIQNAGGFVPQEFLQRATSFYNIMNSEAALAAGRAVVAQHQTLITRDGVWFMSTPEEIRGANATMSRWLMADPYVRGLYLDRRIQGFPEQYNNIWHQDIGVTHRDYRLLHDGMIQELDDGTWIAPQYGEVWADGEIPLSFAQRRDVIDTSSYMVAYMQAHGADLTDVLGGDIAG